MKCPECKEPDLAMVERQGVEIAYGPKCRGVWLDRGELDKIIEGSAAQRSTQPLGGQDDEREEASGRSYRKRSWLSELFD